MEVNNSPNQPNPSERGAALITTLLIATLLLIVGSALILTTQLAQGMAIDSTAEMQAYYSAEAGVNVALNVLRGNVAAANGTKATFRNAVSNPSLNTWLTYGTAINGDAAISLGSNSSLAYSIAVSDPDNTPAGIQPERLKLNVTGYGPRGSRKQMELVVSRYLFDFSPISTILVRGNDDNSSRFDGFAIGDSNAKTYSGYDHTNPSRSIPVFGTTHPTDFAAAWAEINSAKPNTVSGVDKVAQFSNSQLPEFLQTADNARDLLNGLQASATNSGRYFTSTPNDFGTSANPKFTFVDGDCSLSDGAGLLVVTGKLTASGNVSFNGIILVLGEGVFQRNGGGNGDTWGAIVVAKFARTWPSAENGHSHPFLSPTYDMNGGGNSTTGYDSNEVDRALASNGLRSLGIREY